MNGLTQDFVILTGFVNNPDIWVVGFYLVNLWDSEEFYRTDLNDSNPISKDGLWFRWRMFRSLGRMQIQSKSELHFPIVPYFKNMFKASILLHHYGYISEQVRSTKYGFYQRADSKFEKHDSPGKMYSLLLDGKGITRSIELVNMLLEGRF